MRYGQGKVIAWNPETFENIIEWNGQSLHDLPVVGSTDALSFRPGQFVALHSVDSSGALGVTQWWIAGRLIVPGEGNAEQVVSFMRGQLAREISAEIFADRISNDYDEFVAERNLNTWGDPTNGADPGPSVTVNVSDAGRALVMVGCNTISSTLDSASVLGNQGGLIGVEVSGDTTLIPDNNRVLRSTMFKYNDGGAVTLVDGVRVISTLSFSFPVEVNPGENTFTMKYAKSGATNKLTVDNRSLTVIAF